MAKRSNARRDIAGLKGPLPLFTRHQLANIFNKDPRTIAKWLDDGLPVARRGTGGRPSLYRLQDCVPWVINREIQTREEGTSAAGVDPHKERALLDRRRREELELKLQVRRGQLVEAKVVRAEWVDLATAVKSRLRAIPDAVADQVASAAGAGPATVKVLIATKIDDALRELARGAEVVKTDTIDDDAEPAEREGNAPAEDSGQDEAMP